MDYNMLANQSVNSTNAPSYHYPDWRTQSARAYIAGFERAYRTNRAPFFIGNHFEQWNGGIYMKAVDRVVQSVCTKKDVKCVSFKELADWLDVQKPENLQRLRSLDPAQSPDWSTVIK